jgi:hypothetical protein
MPFFNKKNEKLPPLGTDNLDEMTVRNLLNDFNSCTHGNEPAKILYFEEGFLQGTFTMEQIQEGYERSIQTHAQREKEKAERQRIAEEERKQQNRPELMHPKLFARRNVNPEALTKFHQETPIKDLKDVLAGLKNGRMKDYYPSGTRFEATQILENAISKRIKGEAIGTLVQAAESVISAENAKYTD